MYVGIRLISTDKPSKIKCFTHTCHNSPFI
nr:MAG TPA: hypothetical protein [Inoviridae sp.]